ncbi:transcriptional regulator [Salicibibacter halophilus]|uniref:Transcriptional regulator n=1 Tax=Salicibibacter halophilus TaxID=2502791 RepID=A0A514LEF2_9BACI|nr:transcriptional regulator [Salicibibacter halophilus]QDI90227.1 transcriptional regulator [Salicibibacter halophilus]
MIGEKLKPATFKHIEAELYAYRETKKEIMQLREQIISGGDNDENIGQGENSYRYPNRPTEVIATRLTTDKRLRNLEEIVQAIDRSYEQSSDEHRAIVHSRYWNRNKKTWEGVALENHMHRNTAQKYRTEFVQLVAQKIGWR